jgi:hypothetical protein
VPPQRFHVGEFPLFLHGIVWWDEYHKKIRLGFASKHEARVARDPETRKPTSVADGGVFPEPKPSTTVKFPGEARGGFGVAMRKKEDGEYEGVRCEPFDYTNKWIVGVKEYEEKRKAELHRVKGLAGQWGAVGKGYKERWPNTWSEELDKKIQGPCNSVPITKVRCES